MIFFELPPPLITDFSSKARRRLLSYDSPKRNNDKILPRLPEDHPNLKARTRLVQRHGAIRKLKASARESPVVRRLERSALGSRPGTKRRRSTILDSEEDYAIRHAAWAENRGLINARTYAAKVRDLRQKKAQEKA